MSYSESRSTAVVRRRGELHAIITVDFDGRRVTHTGDRRARQVAQRHWVAMTSSEWCSSGGGYNVITSLPPGKDEHFVRKPRNYGGTSIWLKKANGDHHIGPTLLNKR